MKRSCTIVGTLFKVRVSSRAMLFHAVITAAKCVSFSGESGRRSKKSGMSSPTSCKTFREATAVAGEATRLSISSAIPQSRASISSPASRRQSPDLKLPAAYSQESLFFVGFSTFLMNSSRAGTEASRHSRLNEVAFWNARFKRFIQFFSRRSS